MHTSTRYLRANSDGSLVRVSLAQMQRWLDGEPLPQALAMGRELAVLEATVGTEGYQVMEVFRLLPFRWALGRDGRLDRIGAMQLAKKRINLRTHAQGQGGEASAIERLEADANYLWWPTDAQLKALVFILLRERLSESKLEDFRAKVSRPGAAEAEDGGASVL
jgi:hypothetical protein